MGLHGHLSCPDNASDHGVAAMDDDNKKDAGGNSRASHCYLAFVRATVALLKDIRNNPTPAKIDNVLIDLQALTLDQGD